MKTKGTGAPHPVDVHVGAQLRLRRVYMGFSQVRLAKALGLTFQQIQKYERGVNRISASKLFELAVLLDVPVGFFFDGAEGAIGDRLDSQAGGRAARWPLQRARQDQGYTTKKETTQLIGDYYRISDETLRQGVLALVKSLSKASRS